MEGLDFRRHRRTRGCSRGGIGRLARIVHDELFAGPLRRDLIRDRLTLDELGWQGLADYVDHPPTGTSLRDAIEQEQERERGEAWDTKEHLTAVLIDKIEVLTWYFRRANFEGKPDFPDPIPRPGADVAAPAAAWSDEKIAAMLPTIAATMSN
ncbi:hypothetical protein [Mycolicibacterium mucogenicum]|uniref:Uncharacterized protein n=1 Tax=Mycolicibacterium mucogenicum DSM 44124 TaxID=1226753 RepID=A0A8H2JHU8_MYCMU|nr:hypothetical protein [Mycolicibacterium mucogenicum]KAB7755219.1 hypothetical protein MMUC44124_20655 [Mycolicibacterium mucogenicum DSM 44124]QPG68880.1 hypothetical protein C1S78_026265 [Mycolicibacterium mucogenicum DSM 44124]